MSSLNVMSDVKFKEDIFRGAWVAQLVKHLPLASGHDPRARDRALHLSLIHI